MTTECKDLNCTSHPQCTVECCMLCAYQKGSCVNYLNETTPCTSDDALFEHIHSYVQDTKIHKDRYTYCRKCHAKRLGKCDTQGKTKSTHVAAISPTKPILPHSKAKSARK